jgi:hypothetical protein
MRQGFLFSGFEEKSPLFRKHESRAGLIQKIAEVDHLGIWLVKPRPAP